MTTHSNVSSLWCTFESVVIRHIWMCHHNAHLNVSSGGTFKCVITVYTFECVITGDTFECVIWFTFKCVIGWHIQTNIFIFEYIQFFTLCISHSVGIFDLSLLVIIFIILTHVLRKVHEKILEIKFWIISETYTYIESNWWQTSGQSDI